MQDAALNGTPVTWEGEAQAFADAITDHRAGYWLAAEIARRVIGAAATDEARRRAQKQLAYLGHCSVQYVRLLTQLAAAFPEDTRYPDVAQSVYQACLRASLRPTVKHSATQVLDLALRYNWHVSRINAMGNEENAFYKVSGRCIACGGTLKFYRHGTPGLMIPCPGCLADAKHERRSLLDAFAIVGPLG